MERATGTCMYTQVCIHTVVIVCSCGRKYTYVCTIGSPCARYQSSMHLLFFSVPSSMLLLCSSLSLRAQIVHPFIGRLPSTLFNYLRIFLPSSRRDPPRASPRGWMANTGATATGHALNWADGASPMPRFFRISAGSFIYGDLQDWRNTSRRRRKGGQRMRERRDNRTEELQSFKFG